jgi:hypothetical protein
MAVNILESKAVSAKRGKWSQPGVPHSGWTCIDVTDLGELGQICEMCETQAIRFVHEMENPRYPDRLECGCICAANMEREYEGASVPIKAARDRESKLKNRAVRRLNRERRQAQDDDEVARIISEAKSAEDSYDCAHFESKLIGVSIDISTRAERAKIDGYRLGEKSLKIIDDALADLRRRRIAFERDENRWSRTVKGNLVARIGQFRFIVFPSDGGFRIGRATDSGGLKTSHTIYKTEADAEAKATEYVKVWEARLDAALTD